MKYLFCLIIFCAFRIGVFAQATYSISGTITDTTGTKIASATVFIAGAQNITSTDNEGNFVFRNLEPGNYTVVVNMLGYKYVKQSVTIKDKAVVINIALGQKQVELQEVVIGGSKSPLPKPWQIKLFEKMFIGQAGFAKNCKLLNPEILRFSENKITVFAKTSDFLMVENNSLGYKIKYLLRYFQYTASQNTYFYDGDYTFEPMSGTPEQQAVWERNRRVAYLGSIMHYLRSVHAHAAQKEGFLTHEISSFDYPVFDIKPAPVQAEQLIRRTDGGQAEFRFSNHWFYVIYNPQKASQEYTGASDKDIRMYRPAPGGSVFRIGGQFDSKGYLNEYQNFSVKGYWASKRIAYQLPYEYVYKEDTN